MVTKRASQLASLESEIRRLTQSVEAAEESRQQAASGLAELGDGVELNTGVADAHNLAWKLAMVVHGTAGPELLETYDAERRPIGWLSPADLARETVPARPDASPDPILDRDDVMRDALSDLLQAETRYAPVVDARGAIAGVLSVEIISEFLTSDEALAEEHPAAERPQG